MPLHKKPIRQRNTTRIAFIGSDTDQMLPNDFYHRTDAIEKHKHHEGIVAGAAEGNRGLFLLPPPPPPCVGEIGGDCKGDIVPLIPFS